jgi:hypothetical protein
LELWWKVDSMRKASMMGWAEDTAEPADAFELAAAAALLLEYDAFLFALAGLDKATSDPS